MKMINCKTPYVSKDNIICPCGKCLSCLINKRKKWSLRCALEAYSHKFSSFVTLTYEDEPSEGVSKTELQRFFKRLRKRGYKFRYYAVGEYGSRTHRAHYHLLLFGFDFLNAQDIKDAWGLGFVKVDTLTPDRIVYACNYVTKKFGNVDNSNGRNPEFHLMSRKPALGINAIRFNKDKYFLQGADDVLKVMRINGKVLPVDTFLKQKMREEVFSPEEIKEIKARSIRELKSQSRRLLIKTCGLEWSKMDRRYLSHKITEVYNREMLPIQQAHQRKAEFYLKKKASYEKI